MISPRADAVRGGAPSDLEFWKLLVSNSAVSTGAFARTVMKTSRSKQPRASEHRGARASCLGGYHGTDRGRLGRDTSLDLMLESRRGQDIGHRDVLK